MPVWNKLVKWQASDGSSSAKKICSLPQEVPPSQAQCLDGLWLEDEAPQRREQEWGDAFG